MPQDTAEQIPALGSLPWLLPRARAVLTNHTGAVQRSGVPGLDLADGKLNNGVLISAAAAIDVIWRGSKPVSKNKAVDYVVMDAQGAPFRSDPAAAEKAGKGVFVQAKAVSAEATKLVRAQKDEALVALLSAPWGSVAYLPATAPAAMDLQPAQLPAESPVTGAKRGREQSATPIVPPPPPAIVSPGLPPPSREEILEAQQDFISTVIHGDVLERLDAYKQMDALIAADRARAGAELAQAKDATEAANERVAELEDELSFVKKSLESLSRAVELGHSAGERRRDNARVEAVMARMPESSHAGIRERLWCQVWKLRMRSVRVTDVQWCLP